MSLNSAERARTAADFAANLAATGLTSTQLAGWLGLSTDVVDDVVNMRAGSDPVDVWFVRDAVNHVAQQRGSSIRWSVLTDSARMRGQGWYPLRELPAGGPAPSAER